MGYVRVNIVFNHSDGLERRSVIVEHNFNKVAFAIYPAKNIYLLNKKDKKLVTIEKIDESYKIVKFVETIYIDNVKVFDYREYKYNYCMDDGVCSLDYNYKVEVPNVVFY